MKEIAESKNPINVPPGLEKVIKKYILEVDVLLHTVKIEELVAVYKYLDPPVSSLQQSVEYIIGDGSLSLCLGKFGSYKAAVVQTKKGSLCTDQIEQALATLTNVQVVIAVGFAYGWKKKCTFGDVLVSEYIFDVESTRIEDEPNPEGGRAPNDMKRVQQVFASGKMSHSLESITTDGRKPNIVVGTIVSGPNLVNNKKAVQKFLERDSRSVGGEMEGSTDARIVQKLRNQGRIIDVIIIKGVADFGDGTKGKAWQFSASMAAACYAKDRLSKTTVYRKLLA